MRFLKIACTLTFLVLFLAAPLDAQETRSHLSSDPRVSHARALIEGDRFTKALSILRPLAPGHPDRVDVLFLVGLAALGAAQLPETPKSERTKYLDEAIAAFHRILVDRPELVRVRLELARSFYLKGDDGLSREHFERVLAGNPHPVIASNIRRFLVSIRQRRRWNGYFSITLAPDNNINTSSDAETVHLYGLPFRRDGDAAPRSGVGVALRSGGEYEHPLSSTLQLRAGGNISRTEYEGQDFDQTSLAAHVGPRWLTNNGTEISLLGSARRQWSGGKPQSHGLGVRLETSHVLGKQFLVRTQASYHQREHDEDSYLDGPRSDLSLGVLWRQGPTVQLEASVGLIQERTELERWRNAGQRVGLGSSVDLPHGFTVGVNGELAWKDYEGNWSPFTPLGKSRRDQTQTLRISLFNRVFTVQGFSPKLVLVRESRESNAQLYDYRRTRVELDFVRQL